MQHTWLVFSVYSEVARHEISYLSSKTRQRARHEALHSQHRVVRVMSHPSNSFLSAQLMGRSNYSSGALLNIAYLLVCCVQRASLVVKRRARTRKGRRMRRRARGRARRGRHHHLHHTRRLPCAMQLVCCITSPSRTKLKCR